MTATRPAFVLLVPVKDSVDAKSRLGLTHGQRLLLRRAFAQDAVLAAQNCTLAQVHVVGDGRGLGVPAVADEGAGDLNAALRRAADRLAVPDLGIGVLLADLPCLSIDDLTAALAAAHELGRRCFVADAESTGTTMLAAPPGCALDPRFGAGSAQRHRDSGAVELSLPVATLRRDVDTRGDLAAALSLGVGPHTSAVATEHQLWSVGDAERR